MAKNQKTTAIAVVSLLLVAGIAWGVYYYVSNKDSQSDTPPVLDISREGSELFQGVVMQSSAMGLDVELVDSSNKYDVKSATDFQNKTSNLAFADQVKNSTYYAAISGEGTKVTAPIAYYYSDIAITPGMIKSGMISSEPTQIMIAYYEPADGGKYFVYPPADSDKTQSLYATLKIGSMSANYEIPAFHGFVIYTDKDFDLPGHFYSSKTAVDPNISVNNLVKSEEKGWVLLAVPQDLSKFLEGVHAKLNKYFIQKDLVSFDKTLCNSNNKCEPNDYYLVWFNFGDGTVEIPDIPSFCKAMGTCISDIGVATGTFGLECKGLLCQQDIIEIEEADLLEFGCLQNPKLCLQYGIPEMGDIQPFEGYFDDKIINPGWVDPSPVEDKVRNMMRDTVKAGNVLDFATDLMRNNLDTAGRDKLGQEFETQVGDAGFAKLTDTVMGQEFANAVEGSALAGAYDQIVAFENETGIEVSASEAAAFIGSFLQESLNSLNESVGTDAGVESSVDQALNNSANTELKGVFGGALETTFSENSALLEGAGLRFDTGSKSFSDTTR